jgi:hypothetical protein
MTQKKKESKKTNAPNYSEIFADRVTRPSSSEVTLFKKRPRSPE